MADMMDTLKGMLGDDAEDKIKSVLGALGNGNSNSSENDSGGAIEPKKVEAPQFNPENLEYIMKIKGIADEL